jgi:hypothetical protein
LPNLTPPDFWHCNNNSSHRRFCKVDVPFSNLVTYGQFVLPWPSDGKEVGPTETEHPVFHLVLPQYVGEAMLDKFSHIHITFFLPSSSSFLPWLYSTYYIPGIQHGIGEGVKKMNKTQFLQGHILAGKTKKGLVNHMRNSMRWTVLPWKSPEVPEFE